MVGARRGGSAVHENGRLLWATVGLVNEHFIGERQLGTAVSVVASGSSSLPPNCSHKQGSNEE